MKKSFVKITFTLCTLLLMAAPTQAFAGSVPAGNSKCSVNTVKSCTLTQEQVQSLVKSSQCGNNLSQQFLNCKGTQSVKGIQTVKPVVAKNCKVVTTKLNCNVVNANKTTNNNCNNITKTTPATPATPAAPATPAKPAKPATPVAPTTPVAPATPVAPTTPVAPATPVAPTTNDASVGAYEQQVAALVNKERAANGLPALKVNTKLSGVAEKKAEDMRDKNYFSHTSPTYGSPFDMMKQFGITYQSAGENIAKGQQSPESVMNGWMNSEGHRANILNSSYTEIGIGYVTGSNGDTYWVQMFIRP